MNSVIVSILPIFLLTLLGSLIKTQWLTSDEFWRGLEKIAYFLLFPVLMFNAVYDADLSKGAMLRLIIALMLATLVIAAGLIAYQRRTNMDKALFTSLFQGGIRYNSYIFFGLSNGLYGNQSMAMVAVVAGYMIIFTNVISVAIFAAYTPSDTSGRVSLFSIVYKSAQNPMVVASAFGFLCNYMDITIWLGIKKCLDNISSASLTMGLLCVGAALRFNANAGNKHVILLSCFVKLVLMPAVTFVFLKLFKLNEFQRNIGILYSCLPPSSNAFLLSRQLGGDADSMAAISTYSTIVSVVSLIFLTYILGS